MKTRQDITDARERLDDVTTELANLDADNCVLRARDKALCLMLEDSQIETQRYTSMNLWQRIKWALTKK